MINAIEDQREPFFTQGDMFAEWARGYFTKEKLNVLLPRIELHEAYTHFVGSNNTFSPKREKKALQAFCELNGWVLNPSEFCGSHGNIYRLYGEPGDKRILEHFFIRTPEVAE